MPLVIVCSPRPLSCALAQPRPCSAMSAPSGAVVHQARIAGAMRLAEGMAAGGQRDRLLMVHRHALERDLDVACRLQRVGIAARTFRIDVDEAHLDRRQRMLELQLALGQDARLVVALADPLLLGCPSRCRALARTCPGGRRRSRRSGPPIDSIATLPARMNRSAQLMFCPYFCLIGHSRRRALSRLPLSGQLLSGAKRWLPDYWRRRARPQCGRCPPRARPCGS